MGRKGQPQLGSAPLCARDVVETQFLFISSKNSAATAAGKNEPIPSDPACPSTAIEGPSKASPHYSWHSAWLWMKEPDSSLYPCCSTAGLGQDPSKGRTMAHSKEELLREILMPCRGSIRARIVITDSSKCHFGCWHWRGLEGGGRVESTELEPQQQALCCRSSLWSSLTKEA